MADLRFGVIPDCHIPEHDQKALDCALSIFQWYKPHKIVMLGDFMDCAPVSHWTEDQRQTREGQRLFKDFEVANKVLDQIQSTTKSIKFLEGNHESWIRQAIDRQPEYAGLIDLDINLRFKSRPIEEHLVYGQHTNLGKLWFTHGTYACMNAAKKHVMEFERSIVFGHVHQYEVYTKVSALDVEDKHIGIALGCLAKKNPAYMKNKPNNWVHCCAVGTIRSNGDFNIDPIVISNGKASYAGRTFKG